MHGEEVWLFGGGGGGLPSGGSPLTGATVMVGTGVGCTSGRKREPGN